MRTIVAIAARLIRALRRIPWMARPTLKARKRGKPRTALSGRPSILAVIAADPVADDPPLLECHDAPAERGDDLGVVRRHEDGDAQLVDPEEELDDLP
jgi:hypothetical protein